MAVAALGLAAADTIALLSTAATVGSSVYSAMNQPEAPAAPSGAGLKPAPVPAANRMKDNKGRELELAKRRKGRESTIKTSPLGLGRASVGKKSLLGT